MNRRFYDGADGGIRTRDLCFTKALLYQLSYIGMERIAGIEPASQAWEACIITTIRYPRYPLYIFQGLTGANVTESN